MSKKNLGRKKILSLKKFCVQKIFCSNNKICGLKILSVKKFWVGKKNLVFKQIFWEKKLGKQKFWDWKNLFLGSNRISGIKTLSPNWVWKKNFALKKCGSEEVLSKNILVQKNHDPTKIGSKKFGQNWTSKKLIYCLYEQMSPGHMLPWQMSP